MITTWHTGTAEGMTEDEVDAKVLKALKRTPIPGVDLSQKVKLEPVALRASLLRLKDRGQAEIEYGRGWRKA